MDKKDLISNLSGITSNLQTQINEKANSSHTHTSANISDLQGKLDGKANTSHTHTKSQISDFPTSLPANGGNADTVGNVSAQNISVYIGPNPDLSILNNSAHNQNYDCWISGEQVSKIGLPFSGNWHLSFKKHHNNDGYGTQIAMPYARNELYMRSSEGKNWNKWSKIGGGSGSGRFVLPHPGVTVNITTPGKEYHIPSGERFRTSGEYMPAYRFIKYFIPDVTGVATLQYQGKSLSSNADIGLFIARFSEDSFLSGYDFDMEQIIDFSTTEEGIKIEKRLTKMFPSNFSARLKYGVRENSYKVVECNITLKAGIPMVLFASNFEFNDRNPENDVYVKDFKLIYKES